MNDLVGTLSANSFGTRIYPSNRSSYVFLDLPVLDALESWLAVLLAGETDLTSPRGATLAIDGEVDLGAGEVWRCIGVGDGACLTIGDGDGGFVCGCVVLAL